DQGRSHLTPTFAVIGCYHRFRREPPNPARLAEYVRGHHPAQLKKLEQEHREFDFQQVQALTWLGADTAAFRDQVRAWTRPMRYMERYEQHGYPVFRHQSTALTCRVLLGLPLTDLDPQFLAYLMERQRPSGSFNNTPAADGSDGHVLNTWWGLE